MAHPADVARSVAGIQAQDARAGRLAFRARNARLTAADVDRARTGERSLVRAWAMRGTVHLLNAEDADWMLPLFQPGAIAFSRRRLPQLGMDEATVDRALGVIAAALKPGEPLSRGELVERLRARGIELTVQTRMHLFRLAVSEDAACFGPDAGGEPCLVAPAAWRGRRTRHDRAKALAELARRYFAAFGPATEADYAGWTGLAMRDLRVGLNAIGSELRSFGEIGQKEAWTLGAAPRPSRSSVVRLLPGWDTYTMGYRDRGLLAPPQLWKRVLPGGGVIKPTVIVDGAVAGLWRSERKGNRLRVTVEPFETLASATREAVAAEVADLGRFEDLAVEPAG